MIHLSKQVIRSRGSVMDKTWGWSHILGYFPLGPILTAWRRKGVPVKTGSPMGLPPWLQTCPWRPVPKWELPPQLHCTWINVRHRPSAPGCASSAWECHWGKGEEKALLPHHHHRQLLPHVFAAHGSASPWAFSFGTRLLGGESFPFSPDSV
jgi:hypothetical protein